jgi:glycosyltransferase involved in cell wall biosynthesis
MTPQQHTSVDVDVAVEELSKAPKVSIVLPCYNSAKELPETFSELDRQGFRDREIVIVDDGSTDDTWKVATQLSAGRGDVFVVRTEHRGASHARNAGMEKSRGEIVFFSESDCVYDAEYVQRAVESLEAQPKAGAVCLTGAPLITRSTLATECIDIENKVQHQLLNQGKIKPFYAWVYRREVLTELGGFDERLFQGEDKDLFRRLEKAHYVVAWVPGVNWRHRRDQTLQELAKKWFTRGRSRILYSIKQRRWLDILKTMTPFWATVLGFLLLVRLPVLGALLLLLVALLFVANTVRVMRISWPVVRKKSVFLGYPFFVMTRNFSMAMGYSVALVVILVRKVQGREITWSNI